MKNTLLIVAALAVACCAYAQKTKDIYKFGVITPEEIAMTSYAKDTSANAVILFDVGSIELKDDLNSVYKRHIRIKFFNAEAVDEWANKTLNYYVADESISKLKASTYNMENGKLVESKLADDGIFKSKVDKLRSSVKFTLPNVKAGSIIEYSYTKTMFAVVPWWSFQSTIPTIYSEYETNFSKIYSFRKDMQGFLSLSEIISKSDGANERMIMKDAPAFKIEPFLTTPDDYVSAMRFQIVSAFVPGHFYDFEKTWPKIAKEYDESQDFGLMIKSNGWLDKTVEPLLVGQTNPEEKAKIINDYIKSNIAWNEVVDRIPDHTLKRVLDEKKGSSSEINMLMVAMMRRAGLDAYPVLISTRDNGIIRPFTPDQSQFNDVVCMVNIDGKQKLFDGTDKTLPYNALPERCLNGEGLIVSRDKSAWIPLTSSKSRLVYIADFKLKDDGEMAGKLSISRDGLYAGAMRSTYASLGKEKYISDRYGAKSWEFSKSDFQNLDAPNSMAKEDHEIIIRDHAQTNGDIIYISPYVSGLEQNDFKSENREYPVNIPTAFDRFYTAKIEIPAGYKVEELPASKMLLLPDNGGKFVYSVTVLGNTINFMSQLVVTKNVILPQLYPQLREFYSLVVAKQAEQIVLKKAQ